MKRVSLVFCLLMILSPAWAQKQAYNWFFGYNAGISFATVPPSVLTGGMLNTREGCAAISDKDGNLLFYSDGITVWNKNHQVMTNGSGLKGHPSSTQSALIVPWPGDPAKYYVFTTDAIENGLRNGFNYSLVDMSLQGGLGEVTGKNLKLLDSVTEKLTAVRHHNKQDIWVMVQKWRGNGYYAYRITPTGIDLPKISNIGVGTSGSPNGIYGGGYMKFSPDGKRLAVAHSGHRQTELFKFNPQTGLLTDMITIPFANPMIMGTSPYGVEFSPDSKKLYISNNILFQYNLKPVRAVKPISGNRKHGSALREWRRCNWALMVKYMLPVPKKIRLG